MPSSRTGITGTPRREAIIPTPGRNGRDFAMVGPFAFGKDQHREAVAEQLARIAQRLARARLALRQRERVEECRRQVVLEASRDSLAARVPLWEKMRLEEFLRHRGGDTAAPPSRQRRENHRHIHVALMIRREDHRALSRSARFSSPSTLIHANTRVSGSRNAG